jgi:ubiquinone/menaquinone biosynthesis C-methylase UbiE
MNIPIHQIREDFDRIALLAGQQSASSSYHRYLLHRVPSHCEQVLEIGCGTGDFTRFLAMRSQRVVAIDLSAQMLRLARQQSVDYPNIEYVLGDVMQIALPASEYDCITTLATMHHLPLHQALPKVKAALKPNGALIIHDLIADDGFIDKIIGALAYPVSVAQRFLKTGRLWLPRDVRRAWAEHGKGDTYLRLNEVREMTRQYLPGALVHRHLRWRYTVFWHNRGAA